MERRLKQFIKANQGNSGESSICVPTWLAFFKEA